MFEYEKTFQSSANESQFGRVRWLLFFGRSYSCNRLVGPGDDGRARFGNGRLGPAHYPDHRIGVARFRERVPTRQSPECKEDAV